MEISYWIASKADIEINLSPRKLSTTKQKLRSTISLLPLPVMNQMRNYGEEQRVWAPC
jgi:hypothetical protein